MYKSSPTFLYSLLDVLVFVSEEAVDSFTLSVHPSTSSCHVFTAEILSSPLLSALVPSQVL